MLRAYESEKIRTAEAPLLDAGVPLMRDAARALEVAAVRELRAIGASTSGSVILALVGGGNNGGDALYAAAGLARRGAVVHAALCSDRVHGAGLAAARHAGVRMHRVVRDGATDPALLTDIARRSGLWLDGLAGIGVSGALRSPLAEIVALLVTEKDSSPDEPLVIAVDVPSGLGDGGASAGPVLPARLTVTMGAPKPALLLPPAAALAGRIEVVDLGLPLGGVQPDVVRPGAVDVADLFPWPHHADHKYTRGVLAVWAGSQKYQGAAQLVVAGALGIGPGMVRYLGDVDVVSHHPEVVTAEGRIQAAVVGSGTETAGEELDRARAHGVPCVLDAGAIGSARHSLAMKAPTAPVILTPHAGELAALLDVEREAVESDPATHARRAATELGAIVVAKGPTTLVVPPDGPIHSVDGGTPWLATAGSGDVLAGAMGAVLALGNARTEADGTKLNDARATELAAAAVWLHGRAGVLASGTGAPRSGISGRPITAGDVARHLPDALAEVGEWLA